jgi:hypothetical protein
MTTILPPFYDFDPEGYLLPSSVPFVWPSEKPVRSFREAFAGFREPVTGFQKAFEGFQKAVRVLRTRQGFQKSVRVLSSRFGVQKLLSALKPGNSSSENPCQVFETASQNPMTSSRNPVTAFQNRLLFKTRCQVLKTPQQLLENLSSASPKAKQAGLQKLHITLITKLLFLR